MNKREKAAMTSERDRMLLAWVATCGVLSVEQMKRVPGFDEPTRRVLTRRLEKLSGKEWVDLRLLERVRHDSDQLVDWHAWKLTARGQEVIARYLDPAPRFMEVPPAPGVVRHHFEAADLPLKIAQRLRVRDVARLPFSWSYERAFNLSEFDPATRLRFNGLLNPDGVLVIPAAKRILLVEFETGTQTIQSSDQRKTGSTMKRIGRYVSFFTQPLEKNGPPAVKAAFDDDWPVDVLLVYPDGNKVLRVKEAIAANYPTLPFNLHVLTLDAAADQIAKVIIDAGVPVEPQVEDDADDEQEDAPEVVWTYVGSGAEDGPKIALSIEVADQLQHYLRHVRKLYGANRHELHAPMSAFLDDMWIALGRHFSGQGVRSESRREATDGKAEHHRSPRPAHDSRAG